MTATGWPNYPQEAPSANVGTEVIAVGSDVALPPPTPKASQRLRLSSIADCKREIRRLYIDARNGELSSAEAGRFVWIIQTLANLIADHDLEQRLTQLERK